MPVEAIRFNLDRDRTFPTLGIYHFPSERPEVPGHVILIEQESDQFLSVFDPAENPRHGRWQLSDFPNSRELIVFVPEEVATRRTVSLWISSAGKSVAIALILFVGWLAASFFKNRFFAVSNTLVCLVAISGCGQKPSEVFAVPLHDFGVIYANETANGSVRHVFIIQNPNATPIKIEALVPTCSCVVSERAIEGTTLGPGEQAKVPVNIDVSQKVGLFKEQLSVRIVADESSVEVVTLEGFVVHDPVPAKETVIVVAPANQEGTVDAEVVYVRTDSDLPAKLGGFRIVHSGEDVFDILPPSSVTSVGALGGVADVWKFPVKYRPASLDDAEAQLVVNWESPEAKTTIHLIGRTRPAIDLQDALFIPIVSVNRSTVELLPVKISDKKTADEIEVRSDNEYISGRLLPRKNVLELQFDLKESGSFTRPSRCCVNQKYCRHLMFEETRCEAV